MDEVARDGDRRPLGEGLISSHSQNGLREDVGEVASDDLLCVGRTEPLQGWPAALDAEEGEF